MEAKRHYQFSASILAAKVALLGEESQKALAAGVDMIHIDVMDNHYVPNLTFGPLVCKGLREYGINAPLDVHLMVKPVDQLIVDFAKAGAAMITIHPEATEHLDRSLALIRDQGCVAGIALNPATPLNCLDHIMHHLGLILVMSVNPGFTAQAFIPAALPKIATIRQRLNDAAQPVLLAVDGGVNSNTIKSIADAGADTFITGAALFHQPNYQEAILNLRQSLLL